jgi:hypothetical protein
MTLQAHAGSLEVFMPTLGPSPHGYVTKHAKEVVEAPNYFLTCSNRLKRGDYIRVAYEGDSQTLAVGDYVVMTVSRTGVSVACIQYKALAAEAPEVKGKPKGNGLKAVHVAGPKFDIVEEDTGRVLGTVNGKEYAERIVSGQEAMPEPEDLARDARNAA